MEYRELSKLRRWYLKYTNKAAYRTYKESRQAHLQHLYEQEQEAKFVATIASLKHVVPPLSPAATTGFKHSGNSGDIVYSLPAVFALSGSGRANLYLHAHQPIENKSLYHPLGNVMLNERMIAMLKPLLLHQPQIAAVEPFTGQAIDYDLDTFRRYGFYLDRGSIVRWYFLVYGTGCNTALPWLTAPKNEEYKDHIVIARSHRYRSPVVDYGFLNRYPKKLFLGIEEEYEDMKKVVHDLDYRPVTDFLEMAAIVNGCKMFIGNQSFPFSLAEALKVPRLLEVYYKAPNVIVEGEGGNDFMFQPQFEYAVERLYKETNR